MAGDACGRSCRSAATATAIRARQVRQRPGRRREPAAPAGGQARRRAGGESSLYLTARELFPTAKPAARSSGTARASRRGSRNETGTAALLLRDYPTFGPAYEVDYPAVFADAAKYLAAAVEAAHDKAKPVGGGRQDARPGRGLPEALDRRAGRSSRRTTAEAPGATSRRRRWNCWTRRLRRTTNSPAINGWRRKGTDLPVAAVELLGQGRTHPRPGRRRTGSPSTRRRRSSSPSAWKSPIDGDGPRRRSRRPRPPGLRQRRRLVARAPPRTGRPARPRPCWPKGPSTSARKRACPRRRSRWRRATCSSWPSTPATATTSAT